MTRISIEEYALRLAEVAALRSEDPDRKVGAVALSDENRVIATSYNGLPKGYVANEEFWKDRDYRRVFLIHAEQNLCSLFQRGEATLVAVTHCPCSSCLMLLIAHGVSQVIYREVYETDDFAPKLAAHYGMRLERVFDENQGTGGFGGRSGQITHPI